MGNVMLKDNYCTVIGTPPQKKPRCTLKTKGMKSVVNSF